MTPAAKPFHEPEENEAQVDMLLDGHIDALDLALERAMHYGLEDKVREVVAKHLPAGDMPSSGATPPATEPTPPATTTATGLKGLTADQVNTLLGFLNCVQVLDEHARRTKPDSPSGKRAAACRDFLRNQIELLKGAAK